MNVCIAKQFPLITMPLTQSISGGELTKSVGICCAPLDL